MSGGRRSLRGAGFAPLLALQRAYVEQSAGRSKFGLVVPEAFIRGIRDLSYRSNGDAIAELIDNALQAYAGRIDILFGYDGTSSGKKPLQLAVLDDGHGMEPDMLRMAVMWGGTHRENDRSGLGRYGYGLPCSAVSLGRRFTVMSQVSDGNLYAVTLDLDSLMAGEYTDRAGDIIVPPAIRTEMPSFVADHVASAFPGGWISGTIILIEKLDRLEWSTAQGLRENLCRQFGVTYHKLRGEVALYVDGAFVGPVDPLFLTPEFGLYDLDDDRAQPLDPVRVEVRNPETNTYLGALTVRYAWLPPSFGSVDKTRDAAGLNANSRFSILKDYHGVIYSRNGRLIDVQTRTPWTSFINNDRYIKVEVEFSASLDELFGVTTSKQQVTVSAFMWDVLRQAGLPRAIEQLRNKVRDAKLGRRLAALTPQPGERRLSEQVMSRAADQLDLALRTVPYKVCFEKACGEPFFWVNRKHGACTLHINTGHRFYEQIYDGPIATAELRAALEVLLFCIGEAVLDPPGDSGSKADAHILSWSQRLELALEMLAAHLSVSDNQDVGIRPLPDGG
jgi:hypothetical protein